MKNLWFAILLSVFVLGCRPVVEKQPYIPDTVVTDVSGKKYRFVSPAMANANGTVTVELWERIEPLDTNRWYTPTLGSKMDTNSPPMFHSLMR